MYIPTDYQKSAFKVDEFDLKCTRNLPHAQLKRVHQYTIAKWTVVCELLENEFDLRWSGGGDTCALCHRYEGCEDCPVAIYADVGGCHNTPYYEINWLDGTIKDRLKGAKKELAFLQKVYEWWLKREGK